MKTETKAQLRAELERIGGLYNQASYENIKLKRKLAALELVMGIPPEKFRARTEVELVRKPRQPA